MNSNLSIKTENTFQFGNHFIVLENIRNFTLKMYQIFNDTPPFFVFAFDHIFHLRKIIKYEIRKKTLFLGAIHFIICDAIVMQQSMKNIFSFTSFHRFSPLNRRELLLSLDPAHSTTPFHQLKTYTLVHALKPFFMNFIATFDFKSTFSVYRAKTDAKKRKQTFFPANDSCEHRRFQL